VLMNSTGGTGRHARVPMGTVDLTTRSVFKLAKNYVREVGEQEFGLNDFCVSAVRSALFEVQLGYLDDAVDSLLAVPPRHLDAATACFVRAVEAATDEWNRPCPYTAPELQG